MTGQHQHAVQCSPGGGAAAAVRPRRMARLSPWLADAQVLALLSPHPPPTQPPPTHPPLRTTQQVPYTQPERALHLFSSYLEELTL